MSGMASSRSPRRALSRAKYTSTIGNSHRLCPRRRNTVADLGQELLSAVTLRSRLAVHQRKAQRHPGEGQREIITGSFGNPQGILDLAHRAIVGPQHAIRYSREVDVA